MHGFQENEQKIKHGLRLLVFGLVFFASSHVVAENPFLEPASGLSDHAYSEINSLKREISELREDFNTLYMANERKDNSLSVPPEESDFIGSVGTKGFDQGYFEINGMYILKGSGDLSVEYLKVSKENFEKSLTAGLNKNTNDVEISDNEENDKK